MCVCVRLKGVIADDNQENDKSDNATFLQILISFYIQSEASVSFHPRFIIPPPLEFLTIE